MPRLRTNEDVLENAKKLCEIVKGATIGLPGMDIIVYPEHSTMGIMYDRNELFETACAIPGPVTDLFCDTSREVGVCGGLLGHGRTTRRSSQQESLQHVHVDQ